MTHMHSVLIVDDEPSIRHLMVRWAESLGLQPRTAANADEAVQTLRAESCDLAVIDVMMPGKNGLWLASELRRDYPHMAVILATAHIEEVDRAAAPVADLLIKPFKRDRFIMALDRGREWRRHAFEETEWERSLHLELRERVSQMLLTLHEQRRAGRDEQDILVDIERARVPDVVEHSERVARYAVGVAAELRLPDTTIARLDIAARFHDLGKTATPESVLTKPSPLTSVEVALMREHVDSGADVLEATHTLQDIAPLVRASHEWFGGTGYPKRLAGAMIPIESRIIAVADAYDAMTQDRQYRTRLSVAESVSELLRSCPRQFDPDVVVAFLNIVGRH